MKKPENNIDRPRFFLGFLEICGVYRSLEQAMQQAGLTAYFLNLGNESRKYSLSTPLVPRLFMKIYHIANNDRPIENPIKRFLVVNLYKASIVFLYLWIAARFDVVMLKSGESLLESKLGLKFLKFFGKTIIFSYHGSDSRPFYLNGVYSYHLDEPLIEKQLAHLRQQATGFEKDAGLADFIIDSPSSAHLQKQRCCLRQVIFNPAPVAAFSGKKFRTEENRKLRILHAPSDPLLKGSVEIREAIGEMKKRGYDFDYFELSGMPNEVVIDEVLASDVIIDELYSDNYGGILALEGITAHKVVIVGGYALSHLNRFVPEWARMPTVYCNPADLSETLETLLSDPGARAKCRQNAQRYIENVAAPDRIVERLIQLARGNAPESWFFDPGDIRYTGGATAPLEQVHTTIRYLVDKHDTDALCLNDKPGTMAEILKASGIRPETRVG